MLEVDFHTHSHFSLCGLHSIKELLSEALDIGMKGIAITDHGPSLKARVSSVFFERLIEPVPGIRLLKGQECNICNNNGDIDFPIQFLKWADIILLGLHPSAPGNFGTEQNTYMLLEACRKNPYVDIITHPNDHHFPVDFEQLADFAKKTDLVLELNNSKIALKRVPDDITEDFLSTCKKYDCRIAVCSDAHALNEIGQDRQAQAMLKKFNYAPDLIVNNNADKAFTYIEERKKLKLDFIKRNNLNAV